MSKVDDYRNQLRSLKDWEPFLRRESGLPGPRGNLELAHAVAEEANPKQIAALLRIPPERAPENSPEVFLVFCGVTALGKQAASGDRTQLARLRGFASDLRWRIREAVAIALQYFGDADMGLLVTEMGAWAKGNCFEKRAAAATLAEPRLLRDSKQAAGIIRIFDRIMRDVESSTDRRSEGFTALRKTMGYCWSVVIAAFPQLGKGHFEKWLKSSDRDIRWIMKENLKKQRLVTIDAAWIRHCMTRLDA